MSTVTIREVAQDYSRSTLYFSHVLILRFLFTTGVYICLVVFGGLWQSDQYPLIFMASCGLFLFPEALRKSGIAMLSAYERMDIVAALEVLSIVVRYLPFLIVILLGKSLYTAFYFFVGLWIGVAGIWLVITKRYCLTEWTFSPIHFRELQKILYESYPFGILTILSVIYFKIDIFMLAQMQGTGAVGFYEGAYKFIEASFFIPVSIVNVLLPVMSRSFTADKVFYKNMYMHATRILTMGILPVAVLVTFFSKRIILLVFEEAYLPSASALSVIIWALFFMFVNAPVGNIIATSKSIHAFLPFAVGNVLFNVLLNVILIPKYSFLGACIATVLTEFVAFSIQLYFANRVLGSAFSVLRILGKLLIAGAGATLVFYAVTPYLFFPLNAILFLGIYVAGLFLVKAIDQVDSRLLNTLVSMVKEKISKSS